MPSLSPFSLPGRFWRGNLHTHSTLSDGALEPPQVIEAYKNAGYDFMMLSDHFMGHYNWPVADTRALRSNNFTTIIGSELHAPQTQVGELWHIVAAGLPLDFPPAGKSETGEALARRAHEAGAFIGIAHPAWSQLTIEDGRAIDCAHAVEIYNHGCAIENDRGDGWYLLDQLLNEGKAPYCLCHRRCPFQVAGSFRRLGSCEGGKPRAGSAARSAQEGPLLFKPGAADSRHLGKRKRNQYQLARPSTISRFSAAIPAPWCAMPNPSPRRHLI